MIDLSELVDKTTDADFQRELVGYGASRLMELELEGFCGAGPFRHRGRAQRGAHQPAQRLSAAALGNPRRHGRPADTEAAQGQLLSRVSWNRDGSQKRPWWPSYKRPTSTGFRHGRSMIRRSRRSA